MWKMKSVNGVQEILQIFMKDRQQKERIRWKIDIYLKQRE